MMTRYFPRASFIVLFSLVFWGAAYFALKINGSRFLELAACLSGVGFIGAGWLMARFGSVRRSPGIVAASFLIVAIGGALMGFLFARKGIRPGAVLGGGAVAMVVGAAMPRRAIHLSLAVMPVLLVILAASFAFAAYGPGFTKIWMPHVLFAICVLAGAGLIFRRSPRQSPASITIFLLGTLVILLSYIVEIVGQTEVQAASGYFILLASVPLIASAAALSDVLDVEKQLKSGVSIGADSSMIDALTKVSSRRALDTFGPQLCKQSYQTERPISLLMLDVDNFKHINDNYGHAVGDAALRQLASVVSNKVRASDLVGRLGGDEFVVVLPGSPLAPAMRLAEAIRIAVNESSIPADSTTIRLATSIGVVTSFPEDAMEFGQLVSRADGNLYRAKRAGRNRVMADAVPYE